MLKQQTTWCLTFCQTLLSLVQTTCNIDILMLNLFL